MIESIRLLARKYIPRTVRRQISRYSLWPPVGLVRLASLHRLKPISRQWGFDRGLPVDRYYIEKFLAANTADIHGHVLEVKEDLYTSRFGGDRVTRIDIIHPEEGNPKATIVADLAFADPIHDDTFDSIILTQTLHLIYDTRAAVATLYRILKPGGVLLTTVSGISKISREDMDRWGHHWSFTNLSAQRLFEEFFPKNNIQVEAHGNVLAAIAFLHGLASEELLTQELDYCDLDFQVLVTIRAVKPESSR